MNHGRKYDAELESIETQLLIEGVRRHSGVDLEEYSGTALRRRIWAAVKTEKTRTISGLLEKLLHDPETFQQFLDGLVSSEPSGAGFFRLFRNEIAPRLRTYPFVKVWQAGCDSLRDLYFIAIILHEEGLYEKATIYATDLSETNLQRAREGQVALQGARELDRIYRQSGGRGKLSEYFSGGRETGLFKPPLRRNIVFSQHNLATDGSFNEFNAILCRQLLDPLSDESRLHAHEVFYQSLGMFGILALGPREGIRNTPRERAYEEVDEEQRLFRKIA